MNRKGIANIIVIIILLAGIIILIPNVVNVGQITGTGQYIERPIFKYVKCEEVGSFNYGTERDLDVSGQYIPQPTVTDRYTVKIKINELSFATSHRLEYYICNSRVLDEDNCELHEFKSITDKTTIEIDNVKPSQVVWAQYQKLNPLTRFKWVGREGATYRVGFTPFGLKEYNVLGGVNVINPNSCTSSTTDDNYKDRFISSDSQKVKSQFTEKTTFDRELEPFEVRNFVAGYVTSASPTFMLTYKSQEAWCKPSGDDAIIYRINNVRLGSGNYKIASVDWNDELGRVECCKGDKRVGMFCNDDFKWENIVVIDEKTGETNQECSVLNPCDAGEWSRINDKIIGRYRCIDNSCQLTTKEVGCSNNGDCAGSNLICDTNKWECVKADVNLGSERKDPLPDNQADCEKKGGTWITEEETVKEGALCLGGFGLCEKRTINRDYCKIEGFLDKVPITAILVILTIAVILFLFKNQIAMIWRATIGRVIK